MPRSRFSTRRSHFLSLEHQAGGRECSDELIATSFTMPPISSTSFSMLHPAASSSFSLLHTPSSAPVGLRHQPWCSISLPSLPFKLPWDTASKPSPSQPPLTPPPRLLLFPSAKNGNSPSPSSSPSSSQAPLPPGGTQGGAADTARKSYNALRQGRVNETADETGSFCVESTHGRLRVYRMRSGTEEGGTYEGFEMVEDPHTYHLRFRQLVKSYLLPQGYPESVSHTYAPYMFWRAVQYFFGGAMSVFTTSSLLGALGVAGKGGKYKGEASAAINWVIKDGAGRMGRLLFARWGRELDCELKQFRLAGDLLMESGAALELATIFAPQAFLPLACTANLAKNLAAVAASSTRAPIYKTFALSNNLADITAKGESVANLADILGTVFGIALSKMNLPMFPTFCVLSCGYLIASRKEVDSVELPYLNRARLAYAARKYLEGNGVPDVQEANQNEPLLPWGNYNQRRILLGSSVDNACYDPGDLALATKTWSGEKALLTYRPDTAMVHILLLEGCTTPDCMRAAFAAHLFLHILDGKPVMAQPAGQKGSKIGKQAKHSSSQVVSSVKSSLPGSKLEAVTVSAAPWHAVMEEARARVDTLLPDFLNSAQEHGWMLQQTMLNPKDTRLMQLQPLSIV